MSQIIEVEKERIPYIMTIELENNTYDMGFNYNMESDTFTATLSYQDEVLIYNDPIILDRPLFIDVSHLNVPQVYIIPMDISGQSNRVGYDELGTKVFLYLVEKE